MVSKSLLSTVSSRFGEVLTLTIYLQIFCELKTLFFGEEGWSFRQETVHCPQSGRRPDGVACLVLQGGEQLFGAHTHFQREYTDQMWAREKSVKAEKRDRNAEREKETFRRQRHHQSDFYLSSPSLHFFSRSHLVSIFSLACLVVVRIFLLL